ncbi:hypothetical protein PSTT_02649, partial [Puccinia striiformis]
TNEENIKDGLQERNKQKKRKMRESTFEKQDMDVYLCIDGEWRNEDECDDIRKIKRYARRSQDPREGHEPILELYWSRNRTSYAIDRRCHDNSPTSHRCKLHNRITRMELRWISAQPELKTALKPAPFTKIWAGLSGMDGQTLKLTNDCDLLSSQIQLIHSQSDRPCKGGIVLIAGTGSIATAFQFDSSSILQSLGRIGGHGYLLGDHGSAYYKSYLSLIDVIIIIITHYYYYHNYYCSIISHRSYQPLQSINSTSSLINPILNHFKIDKLDDLMSTIYMNTNDQARKIAISSISRIVMEAAFNEKQQDKFALQILERTAIKLSELVYEMILIYNLNPEGLVLCLGGGMWSIYPGFKELVLGIMKNQFDVSWGWVSIVDLPDRIGAISLASSS